MRQLFIISILSLAVVNAKPREVNEYESYGYGNEMPVDCLKLPNPIGGKGFSLGCPGAVDDEGNSSEELCMTETWWKNCCKWSDGKCESKVTITNLIVQMEKMNEEIVQLEKLTYQNMVPNDSNGGLPDPQSNDSFVDGHELDSNRFWNIFINAVGPSSKETFKCPNGHEFMAKTENINNDHDGEPGPFRYCYGCWKRADGCSEPTGTLNLLFKGSCHIHDACYAEVGRSKYTCDVEFLDNMRSQCRSRTVPSTTCYASAWTAYKVVKDHQSAQNGYNWGQAQAGKCDRY